MDQKMIAMKDSSVFDANVFLEKFELFADTPGAVSTFRELILELAFQGKLVARRSEDYDKQWEEISADIAVTEEAEYSYLRFSIPDEWSWTSLRNVGETKPRNTVDDQTIVGFSPMARIPVSFAENPTFEEREWGEVKKGFTHFQDGDVVVAKITPCFQNGKSAVMRELPNGLGAGTTELHVVRPDDKIADAKYLLLFVKSPWFLARGIPLMTGSAGQKRVPYKYFADSPLPLPPLAEQKRIVAKVDELMGLCDRLEAEQAERQTRHAALSRAALARFADDPTVENLRFLFHESFDISLGQLRSAICELAVRGKLGAQFAGDESVHGLVAQIDKERRAAKAKSFPEPGGNEIPFEVPPSWKWTRIGNIALTSDSGWSPQCNSRPREGEEWGVLKVSAVTWGMFQHVENKALRPGLVPRSECEVQSGDYLLSRANTSELVARSVVVDSTPPKLMMSDKIVRFHFPESVDKHYVHLVNMSKASREFYARNASGTSSSMKNVSRQVMNMLPIALPPQPEQKRIVAKVNQLMALVDELDQQLTESQSKAEQLMEAVVADLVR